LDQDIKVIKSSIIQYLTVLKQSGLSFSLRSTYLAAITIFCTMNDINMNKKKTAKYLDENVRKNKDRTYTTRTYTTEEIRKLLDFL
jgi:hypothetical protein